jgi:hypothetical protein
MEKPTKQNLAEEILNLDDERSELVKVPEWNNKEILCKNMTGADRAVLGDMLEIDGETNKVHSTSTTADIVFLGAYNPETGERLFKKAQMERLLLKNSAPLERLAKVINRLSGLGRDADKLITKN